MTEKINNIGKIALYLFFGLMFIQPRLLPVLFIIATISLFFSKTFKTNFKTNCSDKLNLILPLFFIVYLISTTQANSFQDAVNAMELKTSFLLYPLFMPLLLKKSSFNLSYLIKVILGGVLLSFLLSLGIALYKLIVLKNGIGVFFNAAFTLIHPSYLAVALNCILIISLYKVIKSNFKEKFWSYISVFLAIYIVMASSKIGLILLFLNLVFAVFYFAKTFNKISIALITTVLLVFSSFLLYLFVPIIHSKFKQAYEQTFYTEYDDFNTEFSSTGQRIVAWKNSIKLINKNTMWGVGASNFRHEIDSLNLPYKSMKKGIDSHQQFLQTFASTGVFGFIVLFFVFVFLFYDSIKTKNGLYFLFAFNIFLFCLTESAFETQNGVLFFLSYLYIFKLKIYENEP